MIDAKIPCFECSKEHRFENLAASGSVTCDCGSAIHVAADALCDDRIVRCPFCGTEELYVQKDFPERVGMALVATGAILATVAWAMYSWIWWIGILVAFFLVDFALLRTRKNVTVCYRCLAQFRGMAENPEHHEFDLAIGEKYRQERIRREEMRRSELRHHGESTVRTTP
ncbi:MAG: hypothetical protein U1D30_18830 [Planctomycetota bacterium]